MSINLVQNLVVEVDPLRLLKDYLLLVMATALQSREELAVKVVDRTETDLHLPQAIDDQAKHFPVILISGQRRPEEGKANSYFGGWGTWTTLDTVDAAIRHIEGLLLEYGVSWRSQFTKKLGDGYGPDFNEMDGTVGFGFELRTCRSFPEILAISIVHIYYGK